MSLSPEERQRLRVMFVEYRNTGERRLRNELIEAHKAETEARENREPPLAKKKRSA